MLDLLILVALLGLGYGFGSMAERRHFKSIIEREERLRGILLIPEKRLPPEFAGPKFGNRFVDGNVVISVDYFKQFLAGLRALVGGRIRAYETLAERARREAILRMKEQAFRNGAMAVFNCKLETASISKGARGSIGSVEVYAYGTAIIPEKG
jgi:uncharacterized protein YbjQ (UPF0145 family)